ncbi:MAG TPA: potassium-transporting ATPase subunit KdpC [Trebonia sp.]|jgi:K+-transporting ATPase ATPase C chain
MNRLPSLVRQHIAALRAILVFTVICGIVYPVVMWGVAQAGFKNQANGSLVSYNGKTVGSSLLCQEFVNSKGDPLAQYFQPRPSAAANPTVSSTGKTDYGCDAGFSGAANLGPNSAELTQTVKQLQQQIAAFDHVKVSQIPPDAVTSSGSGLDPDISPANAAIQVDRVATTRHLPVSEVQSLVAKNTHGRALGFLGEPAVDVLTLNIALNQLPGQARYATAGA